MNCHNCKGSKFESYVSLGDFHYNCSQCKECIVATTYTYIYTLEGEYQIYLVDDNYQISKFLLEGEIQKLTNEIKINSVENKVLIKKLTNLMETPTNSSTNEENEFNIVGINLEDSFIVGWEYQEDKRIFEIKVELNITKQSEHYKSPKKGEYGCYRDGKLIFLYVSDLKIENLLKGIPSSDSNGDLDWGNISEPKIVGSELTFESDYGQISITAQELKIRIL